MKFEASPGNVVMKLYQPETKSKLIMPDNVQLEEVPTFEIESVGDAVVSAYGYKQAIPYKKGDRVLVAAGRCMPVKDGDTTFYIVDWKLIFAKVTD